jgi:hypothetical protein
MSWATKPTGQRGWLPVHSETANQTCRTMTVLFGKALQQTTRFAESLLNLIGLGGSGFQRLAPPAQDPFSRMTGATSPADLRQAARCRGEGESNAPKNDDQNRPAPRSRTGADLLRPCGVATSVGISPPKPRRNEDGPHQTIEAAPCGARLRPRGRYSQNRVAVLNGLTALVIPVKNVVGSVCPGIMAVRPRDDLCNGFPLAVPET